MGALTAIETFRVPRRLIELTLKPVEQAGSRGYESFVLWGGREEAREGIFEFVEAYVPAQTMINTGEGLLVTVEGEALFRVNRLFYENGLVLAAQIHSHPTRAYHSATDDARPLMTLVGGLSAVIPNFGADGADGFADWAWYRLVGVGEWETLDPAGTIEVVE